MNLLRSLSAYSAPELLQATGQYRMILNAETDPTIRESLSLMIEEVIAELGRRNDAVHADRAKGAAAIVQEVNDIVSSSSANPHPHVFKTFDYRSAP